jgi:hypothetical protein
VVKGRSQHPKNKLCVRPARLEKLLSTQLATCQNQSAPHAAKDRFQASASHSAPRAPMALWQRKACRHAQFVERARCHLRQNQRVSSVKMTSTTMPLAARHASQFRVASLRAAKLLFQAYVQLASFHFTIARILASTRAL